MTIKVAFSEINCCFQLDALRIFTTPVENNRIISHYADAWFEGTRKISHRRSMIQLYWASVPKQRFADVFIDSPCVFIALGKSVLGLRISLLRSDFEPMYGRFVVAWTL